jgi:excisionase family DNA binding protein
MFPSGGRLKKNKVRTQAVYKPAEVARLLRVDSRTVYGMISRGDLPVIKAGRVFRIPAPAVDNLLQLKKPPSSEFDKRGSRSKAS